MSVRLLWLSGLKGKGRKRRSTLDTTISSMESNVSFLRDDTLNDTPSKVK